VRRFVSSFSLVRYLLQFRFTRNLKSTRNCRRLIFCGALFGFATAAFAATTVTVLSPKAGSGSGSPIFYEAYATSPSCASGISAMRIYSAVATGDSLAITFTTGALTALSGPLQTDSANGMVMAVGAAPKSWGLKTRARHPVQAASCPTLRKSRRVGHPLRFWLRENLYCTAITA